MNILETYIKVMDSPLGGQLAMRKDGLGYTVDYYDKLGSFSHAMIRHFSQKECLEFMEETCQLEGAL
jgi:hypothetical protein